MFGDRYFPARYFPNRHFGEGGSGGGPGPGPGPLMDPQTSRMRWVRASVIALILWLEVGLRG